MTNYEKKINHCLSMINSLEIAKNLEINKSSLDIIKRLLKQYSEELFILLIELYIEDCDVLVKPRFTKYKAATIKINNLNK